MVLCIHLKFKKMKLSELNITNSVKVSQYNNNISGKILLRSIWKTDEPHY